MLDVRSATHAWRPTTDPAPVDRHERRRRRRGRWRLSLATALVVGASGCRTTVDDEVGAPSGARPGASAPDTKISVTCIESDQVPAASREAVEAAAREIAEAVRKGELERVWGALHPQATREDKRASFMEALRSMHERLEETGDTAMQLEALHVVDVAGGANDLARIACGDLEQDPMAFTWTANVGGEDIAVVRLLVDGSVFSHAVTVQLRERGQTWRLVGVQVNPAKYRGKDALAFEALADQYVRGQKLVAAYLALGVAQTLASRGASIASVLERRIKDELDTVRNNQAFEAHLDVWTIDGRTYDVQGLSLASTQSDISPVFKYVTPGGLVPEILAREADVLGGHVRETYPELAEQFDAVVFEAYAVPPTEPGKTYDAYRTARFLDGRDVPPSGAG